MMWATVLGVIVSGLILVVIIIGLISSLSKEKPVEAASHSILRIELNKEIVDRVSDSPFSNLNFKGFGEEKKIGLNFFIGKYKKGRPG